MAVILFCLYIYIYIYILNATSLAKPNAVQLLASELLQLHSHRALVSDSWFTSKHLSSVVGMAGYDLYRRDQKTGLAGGVCAYVRSDVKCSIFQPAPSATASGPDLIEILWLSCFYSSQHYYIACCYHPPQSKYRDSQFMELVACDIDYINSICNDAVITVAGDFNQLDTTFLQCDHGLVQMVSVPTHCENLTDKAFVTFVFTLKPTRGIL